MVKSFSSLHNSRIFLVLMYSFSPFETTDKWEFIDPDTGYHYKGRTKAELIQRILAYRDQNKLEPIISLDTVVDNYLCGKPENLHKCVPVNLKRNFITYVKGGIALLTNLLMKKQVTDAEAERRAKICVSCPHNVFPDKHGFLAWSDDIAERATNGRQTSLHSQLGNCDVCSCLLKAKVFYDGPMGLDEEQKATMKKVNCWQI